MCCLFEWNKNKVFCVTACQQFGFAIIEFAFLNPLGTVFVARATQSSFEFCFKDVSANLLRAKS